MNKSLQLERVDLAAVEEEGEEEEVEEEVEEEEVGQEGDTVYEEGK